MKAPGSVTLAVDCSGFATAVMDAMERLEAFSWLALLGWHWTMGTYPVHDEPA